MPPGIVPGGIYGDNHPAAESGNTKPEGRRNTKMINYFETVLNYGKETTNSDKWLAPVRWSEFNVSA
jgi:hypothetical protein